MAVEDRHPDAERLAEYADGVIGPDRAEIERHLAECADCREVVAEAMAFGRAEGTKRRVADAGSPRVVPFRSRRRMTRTLAASFAAAAALVLTVRSVQPDWFEALFGSGDETVTLRELTAALSKEPTRPLEGRLAGPFPYAPAPSPTRGSNDRAISTDVRLAAARIEKAAQAHDSAMNRAADGVARLATGELDPAIEAITVAARREGNNERFQNDLAAALIARAQQSARAEDWTSALTAADRAISLHPQRPEPYFNRALALEGLQQTERAIQAWNDYQRVDPSGPWFDEASQHLKDLQPPRGDKQ